MHPILPLVSTSARPLGRLGRRRGNLGHLVASRCRFGDLQGFLGLPFGAAVTFHFLVILSGGGPWAAGVEGPLWLRMLAAVAAIPGWTARAGRPA